MSDKRDKKPDDGIIVLRETEPGMCGGTDATQDTRAPKEIQSDEMIFFSAYSALGGVCISPDGSMQNINVPHFVSAFATPAKDGCFLFLETGGNPRYGEERKRIWALVRDDIFPKLTELVREHNLAQSNGFHSQTHGLPEDFGGRVDIRYKSGERISFSNNQCPVFTPKVAAAILEVFTEALNGKRVPLPPLSSLRSVSFEEKRENDGFTKAHLTLNPDGTGHNSKKMRFDNPTVYESEKDLGTEAVDTIRRVIENCGLFAWTGIAKSDFRFGGDKKLTFTFDDGTEITADDNADLPGAIHNGFFTIELEITTKG